MHTCPHPTFALTLGVTLTLCRLVSWPLYQFNRRSHKTIHYTSKAWTKEEGCRHAKGMTARLTLDRRQLKHDLARVWGSFMDSSKVAGKPDASCIVTPLFSRNKWSL